MPISASLALISSGVMLATSHSLVLSGLTGVDNSLMAAL